MKTNEEILNELEEVFEIDEGTLSSDMTLDSVEEFDSMAKLSLIVMCDDDFGKKLTAEQLNEFKTIGDIVSFLQA
jgi:acyl carrier protein